MDVSAWTVVGETTNSIFYEVEPRILGAVVKPDTRDTTVTATENIDFYLGHFRDNGPGCLIYVLGSLRDQQAKARHMYRDREDPELLYGVALIVESMLSRAIAAFFLGLSRPLQVPLEAFGSFEAGMSWCHGKLAERASSESR